MTLTPEKCEQFIAKAAELVNVGNFSDATKVYQALNTKLSAKLQEEQQQSLTHQEHYEFTYQLCRCYASTAMMLIKQEKFEEATETAKKATAFLPTWANGWARVAVTLEHRQKYREAGICYREAATQIDRRGAEAPEVYRQKANDCDKKAQVYQPDQVADESLFSNDDAIMNNNNHNNNNNDDDNTNETIKKEGWYVEKYQTEAGVAVKSNNFELAADLFGKAARHEKNRLNLLSEKEREEYMSATCAPTLAILLVNRAAMLCKLVLSNHGGKIAPDDEMNATSENENNNTNKLPENPIYAKNRATLQTALDETIEALKVTRNRYARAHCRLITTYIMFNKLRSARSAVDDAKKIFIGQKTESELIGKAEQELIAVEKKERERIEASKRELENQKNEVEQAMMSRNQVGDFVSVDHLKKRKVEEGAAASAATGGGGGFGSKHTAGYEYCKFCSTPGHTAARCPLKLQQQGR